MKLHTFIGLLIMALISTSCISNKKFEATLAQHEVDKQGFENRISILDRQINNRDQTIDTLQLKLASQNGANACLLYTSPSPRDRTRSRMPSSA